MLPLINPVPRPEPFDHPDWLFEAKFDGFSTAADTVRGQPISRNGDRMKPQSTRFCREDPRSTRLHTTQSSVPVGCHDRALTG